MTRHQAVGRRAVFVFAGAQTSEPVIEEHGGSGGTCGPPIPFERYRHVGGRAATVSVQLASAVPGSRSESGSRRMAGGTTAAPPMVLVIDDDRSFRDLVTLGLVTNGFAVSGASDGLEGLTRLATCRPVAILTDMQMPRMDGLAFCLRVRSMPAFDNTPIVVLSGGDLSSERIVAVTRLPGVTASGKVMPMKALAALLRGGCGAPVARLQTGCVADGTRAASLGSSARPALAGTVGPVRSP